MTVLRSREMKTTPHGPKTRPKSGPSTTPNTTDSPTTNTTFHSPPPPIDSPHSHQTPNPNPNSNPNSKPDAKGRSTSGSGVLRRSLRLAKGSMAEDGGIRDGSNGQVSFDLFGTRVSVNTVKEEEDTEELKLGVGSELGTELSGKDASFVEEIKVEDDQGSSDLGLVSDLGVLGDESEENRKKRKLDVGVDVMEVPDSESDEKAVGSKSFLSLRSGKRVTRNWGSGVDLSADKSASVKSNFIDKGKGKLIESNGDGMELDFGFGFGVERFNENVSQNNGMGKENMGDVIGVSEDVKEGMALGDDGAKEGGMRYSRQEKGKEKLVVEPVVPKHNDEVGLDLRLGVMDSVNNVVRSSSQIVQEVVPNGSLNVLENVASLDDMLVVNKSTSGNGRPRNQYMERFRDIARQNASKFARFDAQEKEDNVPPQEDVEEDEEDWPGPFSTAMKIMRAGVEKNVQGESTIKDKSKTASVKWVPKCQHRAFSRNSTPSLQELCLFTLAKNADAIVSLDSVPDTLRHQLSHLLCGSRRMNTHFFELLVQGSPTEVRLRDCSWLTEEEFTKYFQQCDISNLTVLQLDQCGRCMPDYILHLTLARSANCLPALISLSLSGACRLSDSGLAALVSSAPALRSLNISQCSLLTSSSIDTLANSLGSVLRELYINDCQSINAMLILPALKKLEHLEVLSLPGVENVCDDFIKKFITARGHNLKELVLTDCVNLTDSSMKVIARTCSQLCSLDLINLHKLTDSALGYLANGCQAIQTLKLCRNSFSDEAIAAFLETSGECLNELSLNNIKKVGSNTAISLARHSRSLHSLDLSWCRDLTDEALGLIVDSCLSLKMLKLFGCTQITDLFLNGHSNPDVKIIGVRMSPILKDVKVPDPAAGPLHYSSVSV